MSDLSHEVLLIRHGQAHCNTAGVIASASCRGLTPTGRAQVLRLGHRLANERVHGHVASIHTSPVRRAHETATMIGNLLGMHPCTHFDLRVPDPGPVEGHTWEEVRREQPPDPDRPTRPLIPGGEPWHRYLDRAHNHLTDILTNHPGGRIIVVGHSETVTAALTLLLGTPTLGELKLDTHTAGITRLTAVAERPHVPITGQRWALTAHNDISHLTDMHNPTSAPNGSEWTHHQGHSECLFRCDTDPSRPIESETARLPREIHCGRQPKGHRQTGNS